MRRFSRNSNKMGNQSRLYAFLLFLAFLSTMIKANIVLPPSQCRPVAGSSIDQIEFFLNLLIYKTELYLRASIGLGINDVSLGLVQGPDPIGAMVANLDNTTRKVIEELGLTGVGHLRAIVNTMRLNAPIPRPQLNLSAQVYSSFANAALNVSTLIPPFNVYANTINFLFAAADASSLLRQYYVGVIPSIVTDTLQQLVARIALSESVGFGVIRSQLNTKANLIVSPYTFTVANFTNLIAQLIDRLGGCGVKDEGLIVPLQLGAENRTKSNVVPANVNSLAFPRTEREILRILFRTGNATRPGGIFPSGLDGTLFPRILTNRLG